MDNLIENNYVVATSWKVCYMNLQLIVSGTQTLSTADTVLIRFSRGNLSLSTAAGSDIQEAKRATFVGGVDLVIEDVPR